MVFILIYYLLFLITLTFIPFVVFRYIMAGDEYLITSNMMYPMLWIIGLTFLASYFFTSIKNIYSCFYKSKSKKSVDFFQKIHTIMVSTIHNSIYVTIFSLVGYILGIILLDNVPKLKDLFMSVVHIPVLEYILKGVPLAIGSILGQLLTAACVTTNCG